ncbi:MAG TPA: hypothetical protein VHG10_04010 [Glycomyces sp.]|nr:hypothetical protein [Glycomyces sp.]
MKKFFTAIGVLAAALALSLSAASSAAAAPSGPIEVPKPFKSRIESTAAPAAAVEQCSSQACVKDWEYAS